MIRKPCALNNLQYYLSRFNGTYSFTFRTFTVSDISFSSLIPRCLIHLRLLCSTQGGRMAEVVGACKIFGFSILATAILTLFIPLAANSSYIALIVVRVLMGLAEVSSILNHTVSLRLQRSVVS